MHKYPDFFIFVNLFLFGRLFNEVFKHLFVIRGGWKKSNQIVYIPRNAPKVPHCTVKFSWINVNNTSRPPQFNFFIYISNECIHEPVQITWYLIWNGLKTLWYLLRAFIHRMQTINLLEKPSRFSDTRTRYLNPDTLLRRRHNVLKIRPVYCFAKCIL